MTELTLRVQVSTDYEATVSLVRKLLSDNGFGVLTEIDIAATLRSRLGVATTPRIILGACRPALAHQALELDPRVATLLPCNVVVSCAGRGSTVEAFDPALLGAVNPDLAPVVADARARLSAMMDSLADHQENPDAP